MPCWPNWSFATACRREASYTFKHALVRDAGRDRLLKTYRQELQARIARALEESFLETTDTEPELLAQHCTEAGLAGEAVDYWWAGQQALARSAMAEAAGLSACFGPRRGHYTGPPPRRPPRGPFRPPKSRAGRRDIQLAPRALKGLKEWKFAYYAPKTIRVHLLG